MLRRLATLLVALAVVAGGVATCPCVVKACAIAKAKPMDCCEKKPGLNAPDCCPGGTQLSQHDAAPTVVNPIRHVIALADQVVPLAATVNARPELPAVALLPEPSGAPPGGPLVAQHTSLLL
jgi:hypothetical protein